MAFRIEDHIKSQQKLADPLPSFTVDEVQAVEKMQEEESYFLNNDYNDVTCTAASKTAAIATVKVIILTVLTCQSLLQTKVSDRQTFSLTLLTPHKQLTLNLPQKP